MTFRLAAVMPVSPAVRDKSSFAFRCLKVGIAELEIGALNSAVHLSTELRQCQRRGRSMTRPKAPEAGADRDVVRTRWWSWMMAATPGQGRPPHETR